MGNTLIQVFLVDVFHEDTCRIGSALEGYQVLVEIILQGICAANENGIQPLPGKRWMLWFLSFSQKANVLPGVFCAAAAWLSGRGAAGALF